MQPNNANPLQRLHGLDALRAITMILGILLHSLIPYKEKVNGGWPSDEYFHARWVDLVYHLVHSFRMELFFFIAGFFALYLLRKRGLSAFLHNRKKRILVPFLLSIVTIIPITLVAFQFAKWQSSMPRQTPMELLTRSVQGALKWNGLIHLWFLYFLLYYYGVLALVTVLLKNKITLTGRWTTYSKPLAILLTTLLAGLVLLLQRNIPFEVSTSIFPQPANLLYYGLFFCWGCLNYREADGFVLPKSAVTAFSWLFAGLGLAVFTFYGEYANLSWPKVVTAGLSAAASVCITSGLLQVFTLLFKNDNAFIRYLADASYWMYLVHVAICVFLQAILLQKNWVGILKIGTVVLITLLFTLLSYQWLVRYTIIGDYLHGRKTRPTTKK